MKRLFVCVIAMLLLLPQGVTGRASAGDVDVNEYLVLVRRSNEDIRASLRLVEAKYFSVRSALATQRPAAGLKGNASRVTGDTGGDYTLSVAVTHRFDISGIYGAQERQLVLGYEIAASEQGEEADEQRKGHRRQADRNEVGEEVHAASLAWNTASGLSA